MNQAQCQATLSLNMASWNCEGNAGWRCGKEMLFATADCTNVCHNPDYCEKVYFRELVPGAELQSHNFSQQTQDQGQDGDNRLC